MSFTGLLPAVLLTVAQPTPSVPPTTTASRLDAHLAAWEKVGKGASRFQTSFNLTRTDAIFKKIREYTGTVTMMKPNLFSMKLTSKSNPADWEEYLRDGKSIYEYSGLGKTVTEYKLGAEGLTSFGDSPVMAMLDGLTAAEAKKRFVISLLKEDENYIYLGIKPTLPKDKQEFEVVVLALFGPEVRSPATPYLPALIQVTKPNGDVEKWSLQVPVINPKVEESAFRPRDEPGFTRQQLPQRIAPGAPPASGK